MRALASVMEGAQLEEVGLLLAKESKLAQIAMPQIQASFSFLCEVSRLPKQEAAKLATFAPAVLSTPSEALRAQCTALTALGLDAALLSEVRTDDVTQWRSIMR
mgnify:CR=1 FL=1